jgi:L-threonylcarbamoyladenylate synthase
VTAGGGTVGLSVPAHPIALALLRACRLPLAAPSANRSEAISPTTARHVADSLGPFVDDLLILDGGPCRVGIESTVVDVTGAAPVVLRPGMIRLDSTRPAEAESGTHVEAESGAPARAPGQRARHYAPGKPLVLVHEPNGLDAPRPGDGILRLPETPDAAAAVLYAELRRLDADPRVERIVVVLPPEEAAWHAIRDRLRRAAR